MQDYVYFILFNIKVKVYSADLTLFVNLNIFATFAFVLDKNTPKFYFFLPNS